ncbi:hypothetical protein KDX38_29120 [Pseudomonas sp. CDFA 602]|uniref:Uncharacterized protein n=1 Tax=Pseudomonas cannabina pv. alisalensis TaxID=757414 RepID=A0ABS1XKM5_PSEC1|nr:MULTISPECIES: hypothetical protein [Pseudomonas]MBM0142056.1 hypothetical protein [Pseudomonas cannabina pv. alisalensis]MCD5997588.1 hypothetical protein [Pseudomonas californiensis]MCD6003194.1 hypothetical protein [Pseudomonas californiensis]
MKAFIHENMYFLLCKVPAPAGPTQSMSLALGMAQKSSSFWHGSLGLPLGQLSHS